MYIRYKVYKNVHLERDNYTHAIHPLEDNFTMCGIAHVDYDNEISTETTKKISCPRCIFMVDYSKSIKEKDIKREIK